MTARTDIQWQLYYYPVGSSRLKYHATYEVREGARAAAADLKKGWKTDRPPVITRYVRPT